jgi:hypothetical protein
MSKKIKTMNRDTKRVRKLSDRMKNGELYVVFSGIDDDNSLRFIGHSDPARTPRIYSKATLDPRICDQLLIGKSVESAIKCLGTKTYAVVLPLSAMIEYCGDFEVRRWAAPQRSVSPTEVREYVSKKVATQSEGTGRDSTKDREFYTKKVIDNHSRWLSSNPDGTLADLLSFLECVRHDFLRYEDDELIAIHFEDLRNGSEYLLDFGDPSIPVDGDNLPTFGYRLESVDEDLGHVDELIELVGESFKVADLPSREQPTPSLLKLVG